MAMQFPRFAPFAARPLQRPRAPSALLAWLLVGATLAGCQSTAQGLLAAGSPPDYAAGFDAGCSSGRQAAGMLASYRKDPTRFRAQPLYADGWEDGYAQCQAMLTAPAGGSAWRDDSLQRERDREWRHHVDQAKAQAYHRP
ncbi:hypothetical protein [Stutzerimonas stutzeri]|uniref:hypothetical protein n=1 Tax=Stutzerimonas stutzeri TaxID=316 RepID=UPI003013A4DF